MKMNFTTLPNRHLRLLLALLLLAVPGVAQRINLPTSAIEWQPSTSGVPPTSGWKTLPPNAPFSANTSYWFRFELPPLEAGSYYIEAGNWGNTLLWLFAGDSLLLTQQNGSLLPIPARASENSETGFQLSLSESTRQQPVRVVLQAEAQLGLFVPGSFQVSLLPEKAHRQINQQRIVFQGVFWGAILVMTFYNLFLFLAVKDRSFLYYVLSIAGIGLYFFFFYGFALEFWWPNSPIWNIHSFAFIVPLTGISRILFTQSYLDTRTTLPQWNRLLEGLKWVYILPILMGCLSYFGKWDILVGTSQLVGILGTFVYLIMVTVGVLAYLKGYKPALFFTVANAMFVLGAVSFIFREIGLSPDHFLSRYLVQVGVLVQAVLLSLGLGYRLNKARQEAINQRLEKEKLALKAEQEKKALIEAQKDQLEETVEIRTQELKDTVIKLKDSESHLSKLNQIKDKLFSVISHDLRSPLATLDSLLSLLVNHADRLTPAELKKLSTNTQNALRNTSQLLDNLLNWSTSQMNMVHFQPEKVDAVQIGRHNTELFAATAQQKAQYLAFEPQLPECWLQADRAMLDFILRNLINNALKFTPKEGTVWVSIAEKEKEVEITVSDSGVGMAEEVRQRLLTDDSFHHSTKGTSNEKGVGLGLKLCKEYIRLHKGQLEIESQAGEGTLFRVLLPKS